MAEDSTKEEERAEDESGGDDPQAEKARKEEQEVEDAKQTMQEIEEGEPPGDLEEWPGGKAKYQTYGGPDAGEGYDDGVTAKLGPSDLRHHEDGSITIRGEEVDNPEDYKGDPIPGGPSDPDAPPDPAMIGQDDDDDEDENGSENQKDSEDDDSSEGRDEEKRSD